MADSHALRNRRSRAHAQGDHSLCHRDRCAALITQRTENANPYHSAVSAVEEYSPSAGSRCRRCRVLYASARQLAEEVDSGIRRMAAELRQTIAVLDSCAVCALPAVEEDPLTRLIRARNDAAPYVVGRTG